MAANRCLCEPRIIVSIRNSWKFGVEFPIANARNGSLDRYSRRGYSANNPSRHCDKLYELAETGLFLVLAKTIDYTCYILLNLGLLMFLFILGSFSPKHLNKV